MMGMNLVYGRVEKNRWFITYVLLAEVTIFWYVTLHSLEEIDSPILRAGNWTKQKEWYKIQEMDTAMSEPMVPSGLKKGHFLYGD